jgi:ABC-2 type transport system ATP-binding protein
VMNNLICVENLCKDFGKVSALNDLNLEIPPGIIFGFLGPNGAGKTTTIQLLLGLLTPTSGSATVYGFDTRTQADRIRACTGALLEHTGIYEQMSAEDNLEFYGRTFRMGASERKQRIRELLTHMDLWERRKDRAGNWSRGMKQKLALARALLHRPNLVLLDEPTAGLDVQSAVAIRDDLLSLAEHENVTVFLTTHNMVDAERLCHQVAVIREGRLVAMGRPDELRTGTGSPRVEIKGRNFSPQVLQKVSDFPPVKTVKRQNNHLVIDVAANTDVAALVNVLVNNGAQVEEVRQPKVSLEEVFLKLTGEGND